MRKKKRKDGILTQLHVKSQCKRLCIRIFSKSTEMLKLVFPKRGSTDPKVAGSIPGLTKINLTVTSAPAVC